MNDLIERLRDAHRHSQQRALGSDIFNEAAEAIQTLQTQNADLQAAVKFEQDHKAKAREQRDELAKRLAEATQRLAALESRWISVKDELPKGYCIGFRPKAHHGTQVATVFYDWKMKRWGGNFEVTHWMALPDAPA